MFRLDGRCIQLLFLILLSTFGIASADPMEPVKLNGDEGTLGRYMYYLEPVAAHQNLSIEEVIKTNSWTRYHGQTFSLGYVDYPVWSRITFSPQYQDKWHAVISYLTLDYVDFYWVVDNKVVKHDQSGDLRPYSARQSKGREFSSSLDLTTNETVTLYVKSDSEGPSLIPLSIKGDLQNIQSISRADFVLGVYYGLLIVMAIYNFILYFITRLLPYFFYVLYIVASIFSRAPFDGVTFQMLWPESPHINIWVLPVTFWFTATTYWLFTYNFLNVNKAGLVTKIFFYAFIAWILFLGVCYFFTTYSVIVPALTITSALLLIFGFVYSFALGVSGRLYATIFAAATFSSMVAYVLNTIGVSGELENIDYLIIYGYPIGRTIEIVLFAVALGVRIRYITQRREQAEQEIILAKEDAIHNLAKYQRLYENSLVGNVVLDNKGIIRRANKAFYNQVKQSERETIQNYIYEYFPRDTFIPLINQVEYSNSSVQSEIVSHQGNWYSIMLHQVNAQDNQEYECSIIDITELKKAAELKEQAEQDKIKSLQQLVVGVSHEVNTPLGIVRTSVDYTREIIANIQSVFSEGKLIKSKFEEDLKHGQGMMDLATTNIIRLKGMIDSFKSVSVHQMGFTVGELNLQALLDQQLELTKRMDVPFSSQVSTTHKTVFSTYPDAIAWILAELTKNSVEHGIDDQRPVETLKINMTVMQEPDYLEIIFQDNGAGLNHIEAEHIFDPFVTSKRGAEQKLGLGLYQVYNLVEQILKGKIEVSDEHGLIFTIKVPNLSDDYVQIN